MSDNPLRRYADVPLLLTGIERFQDGLAVETCSEPWWRRFAERNAVLALALGGMFGWEVPAVCFAKILKESLPTRNICTEAE